MRATPLIAAAILAGACSAATVSVPGFDPLRDVPAMENWQPATTFEAEIGHCFAMSLLTEIFAESLAFVPDAPAASPPRPGAPLALDDQGIRLALAAAFAGAPGKIPVGPARDLRAWTRSGTPGEARFRRVAGALQYRLQVPTHFGGYVGKMLRASVGSGRRARRKTNARAVDRMRARIAGGAPASVCLLPPRARAAGHVVMAYAYEDLPGGATRFTLYDCNLPPLGDDPRPRFLTVRAGGELAVCEADGAPVYPGKFGLLAPIKSRDKRVRRRLLRLLRDIDGNVEKTKSQLDGLGAAQAAIREVKAFLRDLFGPEPGTPAPDPDA